MSFGRRRHDGEAPRIDAYDKALALLARREHSQRELHTKLQRAGYAREQIAAAIERLMADHYQDDARFAQSLIRSRVSQGYGPRRLHAELKTHGLDDARIAQWLEAVQVDWTLSAIEQLRRHYGTAVPDDRAQRLRRAQFLLRRGFAAATVRAATQADMDATADPDN